MAALFLSSFVVHLSSFVLCIFSYASLCSPRSPTMVPPLNLFIPSHFLHLHCSSPHLYIQLTPFSHFLPHYSSLLLPTSTSPLTIYLTPVTITPMISSPSSSLHICFHHLPTSFSYYSPDPPPFFSCVLLTSPFPLPLPRVPLGCGRGDAVYP